MKQAKTKATLTSFLAKRPSRKEPEETTTGGGGEKKSDTAISMLTNFLVQRPSRETLEKRNILGTAVYGL